MIIRKAKNSDINQMAEIYATESRKSPYNEPWTEKTSRKYIANLVNGAGKVSLVAAEKSIICGFIIFETSYSFEGLRGFIEELFVRETSQRKGVGTKLMRAADAFFRRKGVKIVNLDAHSAASSMNFYRKLGFRETGNVRLEKRL